MAASLHRRKKYGASGALAINGGDVTLQNGASGALASRGAAATVHSRPLKELEYSAAAPTAELTAGVRDALNSNREVVRVL